VLARSTPIRSIWSRFGLPRRVGHQLRNHEAEYKLCNACFVSSLEISGLCPIQVCSNARFFHQSPSIEKESLVDIKFGNRLLSFSYDYTISLTTLFLPPQISKHNSSIWCFISTGLNPHLTPTNSKCLGQALNPSQVDRRFFFLYRYPPITSGKRPPSINSTATEFRPIPMFFAGAHRRPSGASNMRLMSAWMSTVGENCAISYHDSSCLKAPGTFGGGGGVLAKSIGV
jgi:hypothetical protein